MGSDNRIIMNTYLVKYDAGKDKIEECICETIYRQGGVYCGKMEIPVWDDYGKNIGTEMAIIYQREERINFMLENNDE